MMVPVQMLVLLAELTVTRTVDTLRAPALSDALCSASADSPTASSASASGSPPTQPTSVAAATEVMTRIMGIRRLRKGMGRLLGEGMTAHRATVVPATSRDLPGQARIPA